MILTLAAVTRVHARLVRAGDIWRAHWPLRVRAALIFAHQILPWVRDVRADDYASLDGRADAMTAVLVAFASEHAVFGDEFSTTLTIMELVHAQARRDGWLLLMEPEPLMGLVAGAMRAAARGRDIDVARVAKRLAKSMEPIESPRINPGRGRRVAVGTRARRPTVRSTSRRVSAG